MEGFSSSEDSQLSELSETDDSDLENLLEERIRPKNENFFEETVPQFNHKEYMEHFRVSRDVSQEIVNRFEHSDYYKWQTGPHDKLSSLKIIHTFLWYAGHQTASFRDVADRFGISISCLHKVIKRVTYFLSNLSPEVIQWPSPQEQIEIEQSFRQRGQYPGIIGVVDGTHVKIDKPQEDPDSYINRKGYYSIQVQLVCDHRLKIIDFFTGFPGSVHDARVFRASRLSATLREKCQENHILGDSAYPLSFNLLTPFPDRGALSRTQINYNRQHSSNRIVIEHCNGVLKQKWRQLYHFKIRDINVAVNFIRACCVLHNLSTNDNFAVDEIPEPEEDIAAEINVEQLGDERNEDAVQKRNRIAGFLR